MKLLQKPNIYQNINGWGMSSVCDRNFKINLHDGVVAGHSSNVFTLAPIMTTDDINFAIHHRRTGLALTLKQGFYRRPLIRYWIVDLSLENIAPLTTCL